MYRSLLAVLLLYSAVIGYHWGSRQMQEGWVDNAHLVTVPHHLPQQVPDLVAGGGGAGVVLPPAAGQQPRQRPRPPPQHRGPPAARRLRAAGRGPGRTHAPGVSLRGDSHPGAASSCYHGIGYSDTSCGRTGHYTAMTCAARTCLETVTTKAAPGTLCVVSR